MTVRAMLRVGVLTAVVVAAMGGCEGNQQSQSKSKLPLMGEVEGLVTLPFRILDGSQPNETTNRPVTAEPRRPDLAAPSVKDFLAVCDIMARDLVMSSLVQSAKTPIVVEIRPIENKTEAQVDLTIYPQTIRGMILKSGSNRIVFRDETARRDILAERSHQTDEPVAVDYEATTDTAGGTAGAKAPTTKSENETSKLKVKKSSEVSGRIAETDYFLKGFIYAVTESEEGAKAKDFRYFRFQFRLTDARSGLVVWENDYEVKKQKSPAEDQTAVRDRPR
jgi:hypothetical protein